MRTLNFTLTGLTEDLRPRRDRRLGRAATLVAVLAGIFVLATAELRLDPGNQDFGEQRVGTSGQVASFWLENSSKETFEVETRVEGDAASDFVLERGCPSVAPGERCELKVRFAPTAAEQRLARLVVSEASGRLFLGADLRGMGTEVPPDPGDMGDDEPPPDDDGIPPERRRITFEPPRLSLGPAPVGSQRAQASVRIINNDDEAFRVAVRLAATPTITLRSDGCASALLEAGADCSVAIEFNPRTAGTHQTSLRVTDDRGFPHSLPISGKATEGPAGGIVFSPNPVAFSPQATGTTSPAQDIKLVNTSNRSFKASYVELDAVTASVFGLAGACEGFFFLPNSACLERVQFRPGSGGPHSGTISIRDDTGAVMGTLKLEGSGQPLDMRVSEKELDFSPPRPRDQSVTVHNAGGASFVIGPVRLIGTDNAFFHDSPQCLSQPLTAQASCTIGVHYRAGLTGTVQKRSAELVIEPPSMPAARVQLVWNRPPEPVVTASASELSFGRVPVNSAKTLDVTFTNTGNGAANNMVVGFTSDKTPFSVARNDCGDLAPKTRCVVTIKFQPVQAGPVRATLRVWSTDPFMQLTTVEVDGDGVPSPNVVGAAPPDD